MTLATGRLVALALVGSMAVPSLALAGAGAGADKAGPPKDMGAVRAVKPQYDTGLKPKEEITPAEQMVFP